MRLQGGSSCECLEMSAPLTVCVLGNVSVYMSVYSKAAGPEMAGRVFYFIACSKCRTAGASAWDIAGAIRGARAHRCPWKTIMVSGDRT